MKLQVMAAFVACTMFASGCAESGSSEAKKATLDMSNMDTSIKRGDDFFEYGAGGWMKNNPLSAEYSRFGTFDELRETSKNQIKALFEEFAVATHQNGSVGQKISDLYALGLDSVKLNNDAAAPILVDLEAIKATKKGVELAKMVAKLHKMGVSSFFRLYAEADAANSSMNIASLNQGGINMGDRDYYLLDDEPTKSIRASYENYLNSAFTAAGYSAVDAARAVKSVMKMETELAKVQFSRVELRDPIAAYNKMAVSEFVKIAPGFDWNSYLSALSLSDLKEINPSQVPFFKGMASIVASSSEQEIQDYLAFNLINSAASYLSDNFVDAKFDYFGKTLSGTEQNLPRWKRSLDVTNRVLSEAVGQMYVAKYFPAESKKRVEELVANLSTALGKHIDKLEWMSDDTKAKAHEKLATFHVKIGYPNSWRDYTNLPINGGNSYWSNIVKASEFNYDDMLSDIGKPVDKDEWHMSPQTVNAYYNPPTNEICFPAAILQPPFFYADGDDAINYGAIGVVIGHEMTHGFDDQGRLYDSVGNLSEWWTKEDAEKFTARADELVAAFDRIEVADGVYANGSFTLGENIADQGGLGVSFTAFTDSSNEITVGETIDGFTPEQRFFLSYATVWANNVREAEILRLTKSDPHSLGRWRVNGALPHVDAWYKAFGIKEGDAMYLAPEERVKIW
ncbi:MAG: M13 family metallopeptidase [Rikenellaceae bacterium]